MKTFLSCLVSVAVGMALSLSAVARDQVQVRVNVTSQPAGATVVMDGKERGVTPTTLYDLVPGRHHLKYRLAGYRACDKFFNTSEGPVIEKHEVLQAVKGLLLVKSEPPGATVVIDGMAKGVTPRLVTDLDAKDTYKLKLRKAGYVEQVLTLKFNGREPKVVNESLVLDSGVINIISEPVGADVTVNGIARGKTPVLVKGVPKGRATVKFVMEGFADEVRELAMRAGDQQTLSVVMQAKPGTLHLVSVPTGARFYVNEEAQGVGPVVVPNLKPGDYTVRVEKEGFGTVSRVVKIGNGVSVREEFKLSNVMGRLEVRTCPVGAQVVFDGHLLGSTKGQTEDDDLSNAFPIENVIEGEHVLVVRKEGYAEVTRHPKVMNSKTTVANVRLKRVFVPDVEIVTARGSTVGVLVSNTPEMVTVEVSLGINRSFPRSEIRKINFLKKDK